MNATDSDTPAPTQHESLLQDITARLANEYGELVTRDTLEQVVRDSYEGLSARSRILTHIPAFVDRFARQRLKVLAKHRGLISDHVPVVLFVCERNDAASQMAAAMLSARVGDRAEVHSAGTEPATELLGDAVHALDEVGIEMLDEFPKPVTEEVEAGADVIVTLDAHDVIPVVDDKQYYAWRLPDHRNEGIEGCRRLRDELDRHVAELIDAVIPVEPPRPHTAFDRDLADLEARVMAMGAAAVDVNRRIGAAAGAPSDAPLDEIIAADDPIDEAHVAVGSEAIDLIVRWQPVASDLRHIMMMAQIAMHLERIADCAVDAAAIMCDAGLTDLAPIEDDVGGLARLVVEMTEAGLEALAGRDAQRAAEVGALVEQFARACAAPFDRLVKARLDGRESPVLIRLDRIARLLERGGEHAIDVAEAVLFLITGERLKLDRQVG